MSLTSLVLLLGLAAAVIGAQNDDSLAYTGFILDTPMPTARSDMTATKLVVDGETRIYLVGGCDSDQVCETSPFQDDPKDPNNLFCSCTSVTSLANYFTPEDHTFHTDVASAPTDRYRHGAAEVGGKLYLAGGRTLVDDVITSIEMYDPATNVWTEVAQWVDATSDNAVTSYSDCVYIFGGYTPFYDPSDLVTTYNVNTMAFSTAHAVMPMARGDVHAQQLGGSAFILGGWASDYCNPERSAYVYSFSADTFTELPQMTFGRGDLATGVMGSSVFAIGGETKEEGDATCTHSVPVARVERYNSTGWDEEESIPEGLFRFVAQSYNSTTSIYSSGIWTFGGQGTYDEDTQRFYVKDSVYQYIPRSTATPSSTKSIGTGAIVGIVIAGLVVLILCLVGTGAYIYYRKYHFSTLVEADESTKNEIAAERGVVSTGIELESRA